MPKFEPDLSACNAQAGVEIGQISVDFEKCRFAKVSLNILLRSIPSIIRWCKTPGASKRANLGMAYYILKKSYCELFCFLKSRLVPEFYPI